MTTQLLWACKKQSLGEWEIKNFSIQQIFDLLYYDAEQQSTEQGKQTSYAPKKMTYEEALRMAQQGVQYG